MSAVVLPPQPSSMPIVNGESLYEVVNGQVVETPPMGAFESTFASDLVVYLGQFALSQKLGRVVSEVLFLLNPEARLKRRPDIAFVSYERWDRKRRVPRSEAWDVIPDLAIEVVSESNSAEEVLNKIREYFAAGVRQVWVIYPTDEQLYLYTSPTQNCILTRADDLDGGDVLPGFRMPLATLFGADAE